MQTAELPQKQKTTGLFGNVSFLLMWSSVAASGFGDRVMMLAALTLLGGHLAETDGTSVSAAINFFFFLPYVLFGIPAGWLADKLPRKWIMLGCDEVRAMLLLLSFLLVPVAGAAAISSDSVWFTLPAMDVLGLSFGPMVFFNTYKVMLMMLAVGLLAAIFNPARNATIPQIVPVSQLQSANALIIGIAVIASLIGLVVGGLMIDPMDAGSVRFGLVVGCLFYAVSGTFFAFLKIRDERKPLEHTRNSQQKYIASRYIFSHKLVLLLIGLTVLVWGAAMVVYNAAMGLCKTMYGFDNDVSIQRFTVMAGAIGAGMLCGAGLVAWMNTRRETGIVAMGGLLCAGICTALLAIVPNYYFGLAFAFGVGFFGNITIICLTTLLQVISPNYLRGRVMGLNSFTNTISNVVINFIIWRMPDADNVIIVVLKVLAGVLIVIAGIGLAYELMRGPLPSKLANAFWRVSRLFVFVWHRLKIVGKHNVPHEGAVILAANHTTAIDPIVMQCALPRIVRYVMLQSFRMRILEPLFKRNRPIFLSRDAKDTGNIRQIVKVLTEEQALVGLYPEGGLQRDHRNLQPFQPGIGMIAKRSGAVIVPTWIEGTPMTRNMIWHFLKPSRTTVVFGKPYQPAPELDTREIVEDLRQRIIALSQEARR